MNRKQNLLGFPNQTQSRTVFSQLLPRHYGKAHIPLKNRIGGHVLLYRQELLSDIPAYVLQGQFLLKHSFLPLIPGGKNPPAFSVNQIARPTISLGISNLYSYTGSSRMDSARFNP